MPSQDQQEEEEEEEMSEEEEQQARLSQIYSQDVREAKKEGGHVSCREVLMAGVNCLLSPAIYGPANLSLSARDAGGGDGSD